ncbi:NUDIX hydrolase [Nodularia sp. NIES-3585]|uniref:NUDIX hydrolase n=1 Tax=Nodularia sp. NIES-3585 TaxID=1973477 RepID=UPI000B5CEF16|nr:NUDIX hydrolase [Nodularia sp. NIES-3585]GAX36537.1 NUDIX hydrolase [Nodularia sp. NIES-3585]
MNICYLSQFLAKYPSLKISWKRGDENIICSNPKFGTILHVVVCNDAGEPLYDQPVWSEPIGSIIVPIDTTGRIVLIENFRHVPPTADTPGIYPPSDLSKQGRISLELPRGFASPNESAEDTARREVEEETGFQVQEIIFLGENNTNTTFFLNNATIWLAYVAQSEDLSSSPDSYEFINSVRLLNMEEVFTCLQSGQIICGSTKSALLHYLAWKSKHH